MSKPLRGGARNNDENHWPITQYHLTPSRSRDASLSALDREELKWFVKINLYILTYERS